VSTQPTNRDTPAVCGRGIFQVADLARAAGVTPATIRYYDRIGLLNPVRSERNGYRYFTREDRQRVAFARLAQTLGLTLSDVRDVLKCLDDGQEVSDLLIESIRDRLNVVRNDVEALDRRRACMERALVRWSEGANGRIADLDELVAFLQPGAPNGRW